MLARSQFAAIFAALCSIAGCASHAPPATIDGYVPPKVFGGFMSPQISRMACIDQVVRDDKGSRAGVVPTSDTQTMQDGVYVATLSPGPGKPAVNCTVNENGNVT